MQPKVLIMSKWIWQLGQKSLQIWQYVFLKGHRSPKNIMFSEVDLLHCHTKKSVLWSDPKILPRSSEQWHSTPNRFYRRRIQLWKPRTAAQCWWNPPSSCSQSCSQMRQRSSRLPTAALHSLSGSSEYSQFNILLYVREEGGPKRQIKPQKIHLMIHVSCVVAEISGKLMRRMRLNSTCVSAL